MTSDHNIIHNIKTYEIPWVKALPSSSGYIEGYIKSMTESSKTSRHCIQTQGWELAHNNQHKTACKATRYQDKQPPETTRWRLIASMNGYSRRSCPQDYSARSSSKWSINKAIAIFSRKFNQRNPGSSLIYAQSAFDYRCRQRPAQPL